MRIDISNRIGTTSNFGGFRGLLDKFSGAAAGYSLRKLSKSATNAVRVRRSSDNTEQDIGFVGTELDTTTLLNFVNARDVAPADYGAGAAAAYSLRYVSDSYTGDVVRVRRDSDNAEADFNPTEITDGTLLAWVGNTASDNGYVTTWYDQSGNSNDATQGTAASQPKIVDAGVLVEENGKPAVEFDGSDDNLTSTFAEITQPTTHAVVAKFLVVDENRIIIDGNNNDATRQISLFNRSTGNTDIFAGTLDSFATNDANQNSYFIKFNGALSEASKNGNNTTGLSAGTNSLQNLTIGANLAKDAFSSTILQEIIIYPSDQSSNRGNIEANVNDYYSIYTSTNDGFVTTWYDQSGNGNDATQGSAAAQPKIVSAGVLVTENGEPAVDFLSNKFLSRAASFGISQPISVTTIHAPRTGETDYYIIDNDSRIIIGEGASGGFGIFAGNWVRAASLSTNTQYLSFALFDGSSSYCYVNSSLYASGSAGNNAISTNFTIGANENQSGFNGLNGTIQEIIVFASDQSTNRSGIEARINNYYNIY